jgi:hypothetical protein
MRGTGRNAMEEREDNVAPCRFAASNFEVFFGLFGFQLVMTATGWAVSRIRTRSLPSRIPGKTEYRLP